MDFLAPESPACSTPWQVISNAPELSFLATAALKAGLISAQPCPECKIRQRKSLCPTAHVNTASPVRSCEPSATASSAVEESQE